MASSEEQLLWNDGTDYDLDGDAVPRRMLTSMEGYQHMPLVSLEEAVEPLLSFAPTMGMRVAMAKRYAKKEKTDLLPIDQHAAIKLYTMDWSPANQTLYYCLNAALRDQCRDKLKPWFLYLKLLLTALSQLPAISRNVFRGVKRDLREEYPTGAHVVWWAFSSCTTDMNLLKEDKFLDTKGPRTFFIIEAQTAKDIRPFSQYKADSEFLLPPARQFEVLSCCTHGDGLVIIRMKEINVSHSLINVEPVKF